MRRFHYNVLAVTNRNKKRLNNEVMAPIILNFHLTIRVVLMILMERTGLPWTRVQEMISNNDQVPIMGGATRSHTVESKGAKHVFDGAGGEKNKYLMFSLNLTIPMKVRWEVDDTLPDVGHGPLKPINLPKAHLVCKAAHFCTAAEFKGKKAKGELPEHELYHPMCLVSFQENAWVDGKTHVHNVTEELAPVQRRIAKVHSEDIAKLRDSGADVVMVSSDADKAPAGDPVGLHFRDNLSSYLSPQSEQSWLDDMRNVFPFYVPAWMTDLLQMIDRLAQCSIACLLSFPPSSPSE
jgi:hypothetical protein